MKRDSRVVIVKKPCDVEETSRPFGKRWGQEIITLTAKHIQALKEGKHLGMSTGNTLSSFVSNQAVCASGIWQRRRGMAGEGAFHQFVVNPK